jgi:uncharacterized protein (TIGR02118 family)
MLKAQIWLKKKGGMSEEEFRDHWLNVHAPIARDGYERLRSYTVNIVTGAAGKGEPLFDGLAEMTWDDRDAFVEDMRSEAAARGNDDLANFTDGFGLVYVETHTVK